MKFQFIDRERGKVPVRTMCRHLRVSESGYYYWRSRRGVSDGRLSEDEEDVQTAVRKLHRKNPSYGRPRLLDELRKKGHHIGGNRLRRIMLEQGIEGRCG